MDFVRTGGAASLGLGSENGPILYIEPNRTSAIEDIRSVIIYIIIVAVFIGFFSILPGIRHERFPTFMCITVSLLISSANIIALFGTTWHVGEAPISAAYKAFSRDRIQGELSVKIGLQSVNITLRAHKYYILHDTQGPIVMENAAPVGMASSMAATSATLRSSAAALSITTIDSKQPKTQMSPIHKKFQPPPEDTELVEVAEEAFASHAVKETTTTTTTEAAATSGARRSARSSGASEPRKKAQPNATGGRSQAPSVAVGGQHKSREQAESQQEPNIRRVNVDINFNERFYWIEPDQMRQEHHSALQKGLPYPILTVVEYLSQDDGGFSWSRKYRMAGYYANIMLWVSSSLCVLMFFLHCAAPKYGIYMMQIIGCIHLATNFTYATLVPSGHQKLVIPFEGQSLTFDFGLNYWLVLFSGCLALLVGSLIVIVDLIFPNFIFTTILDVDFDIRNDYHRHRRKQKEDSLALVKHGERLIKPPFANASLSASSKAGSEAPVSASPSSISATSGDDKTPVARVADSRSSAFVSPKTEMEDQSATSRPANVVVTVTPPAHSHPKEADSQAHQQPQQQQQQQQGAARQRLGRAKDRLRGGNTARNGDLANYQDGWSSRV